MRVTLYGGPHDGRTIDADPDETLQLPVLTPSVDGGAPDLCDDATYEWQGRRDGAGRPVMEWQP